MEEKLKDIIAKQLNIDSDDIEESTDIVDDLGADSLDIVEILQTIEEEFGVSIPDEAVQDLKTLGDVMDYLENNS